MHDLEMLQQELKAIELWDDDYLRKPFRDDIDEDAYRARQERRRVIMGDRTWQEHRPTGFTVFFRYLTYGTIRAMSDELLPRQWQELVALIQKEHDHARLSQLAEEPCRKCADGERS